MSFFKPSVFIKTFLFFCAISATALFFSCKQLASFDPGVEGARVAVSNTISAPTGMKATNGLKQKISLTWTPVSGARYYEIYYAESATAEFKKVGETDKSSFDDKVGAGKTYYYKVCAVKSNGTQSPFSITTKGTSLAKPVISGGDVNDSSATITWFMENAEKNYDDLLCFEVFCGEKSQTLDASSFADGSYKWTFENLAGSTDHQIYVRAYLSTDQQSYEESAKVTKTTLTSYMPLAPVFNASEGESAKGIRLYITLPEMVMVNTVTKASPNEAVDEKYPVYFEIYRKSADGGGDYDKVCEYLYYNGSTEPPTVADYQDTEKRYNAGKIIEWFDESANLQGGVKYEYMVRSFVDCNYSKVVCPEDKEYKEYMGTATDKATKGIIGWKSAHPSFKLDYSEESGRTFEKDAEGNNTKVLSYEFGFSASWNDLGKADKYKFAIKQNRKPLDAGDSDNGTDTWLEKDGSIFFATIDEVNSHLVKFGSASGLRDDEKGVYAYTLYIVPKSETGIDESNVLDSVTALDTIQVTPDVNLPEAVLDVKGGYANKVVLTISSLDKNDADVTYKITRTILEGSDEDGNKEFDLDNSALKKLSDGIYEDTTVQGNCRYSYVLTATSGSGAWAKSLSQEAETLGAPVVLFSRGDLSYDSVTITFNGVLAAKDYVVTLGADGGFGGGKTYSFAADGTGVSGNAEVKLEANKFTVTIKQPYGYNDVRLAGDTADLTVTARSDKYPEQDASADSNTEKVNVLGPACLEAQVNAAGTTGESISLTWKEVGGAKGYLIRRVMYEDAAMTKIAEGSDVTYYCDAESKKVTFDGEDVGGRATVGVNGNTFTFTDTYMEKSIDNADLETYQEAQAKLAWGLPFRYVVLPVLGKNDFDFNDLGLKSGSKVAYTNLAPTAATATWGYGLNLVADKATSGNKQGAKWERPHVDKANETDYTATKPVVYRRVAGATGEFEQFRDSSDEVSSEKATMDIKPGDNAYYGAFEYIVKYYPTGKSTDDTISPPESLLAEIAKRTAEYATPEGAKTEQDNKGYLLTIENFLAEIDTNATYYEKLSWKSWNYNTRAVGPDSMVIYIQNNNIGAEAKEAVKIEQANSLKTIEYVGSDIDGAGLGSSSMRIKPKSVSDSGTGTAATDGLLKVLRDYKHNYTFELRRTNGEEPIIVPNKHYETNYIKTAYRQITNEELIKATMLILAAIEHDSDSQSKTTAQAFSLESASGSFSGKGSLSSAMTWHLNQYKHKWKKLPSGDTNVPAFLTLNDQEGTKGRKYSKYFVHLSTDGGSSFKIDKPISIDVSSEVYGTKTITVASSADKFRATVNSNIYSTEGNENCRYWMPMEWYKSGAAGSQTSYGYFGESSQYGWWPPSN